MDESGVVIATKDCSEKPLDKATYIAVILESS